MAKTTLIKIIPSSSPPSSIINLQIFLLSLLLLSIFVGSTSDHHPSKPSSPNMAATASNALPSRHKYQTLIFSDSSTAKTMNLRHRRKRGNRKSKGGSEFEASDHEVPSGPNPISNR
ncbi:hypothetical protein ACP275_14G222200 [Erythranthe tilingii]